MVGMLSQQLALHLSLGFLPPVGLVDRVARLLSLMFNGLPLDGSSDSHVQAQILPG